MTNEKPKKKRNWRLLFLSLLGINIFILIVIFILIFSPTPNQREIPDPNFTQDDPGAEFTIQSTKQDLNDLINNYLDQILVADNARFNVHIDEDVHLIGALTAFNTEIPLSIRMDPVVQPNGDLILKQTEMSLGLLHLPRNRIIHYVGMQVDTPDWLYFDSENEQIYLAISQVEIQDNMRIRVQELDLDNDSIHFRLRIPSLVEMTE
ncbi:uncharacterized protein YpmS [Natronobacillus azotifigens]|uniref:YpmS family protein n=1 Tax=Natronobacillus azotifigens TaxID=472978 RepID=A0A9J6RAC4_9BACI|nr:YpmS family protein [Natronobacillus azotifigens]MCZ0702525.1 YpmS family protein [Natronobacillus azotifigens]